MRKNVIMSFVTVGLALSLGACDKPSGETSVSGGDDEESGEEAGETEAGETEAGETEVGETEAGGDEAELNPHCVGDAIIDDLEHGMTLIPATAGRQGAWYTYNDESPGAEQEPIPMGDPFLPTDMTAANGLYSARTFGEGFGDWGAGFGFDINNMPCEADEEGNPLDPECNPNGMRMKYDVGDWTGISFYGRSLTAEVTVEFKVPTEHETPIAESGTCDGTDCSDSFFSEVTFGTEWQLFEIAFEDLAQGGWGAEFAWDPTAVFGLQWQIPATEPSFDVAVDSICFF